MTHAITGARRATIAWNYPQMQAFPARGEELPKPRAQVRFLSGALCSGMATDGGTVYAIATSGAVKRISAYSSSTKGGADEMVVAPAGFGTGAGQVVLTVDAGPRGALVLMDARGRTREIATLPDGPNLIVAVPATAGRGRLAARRGLYVTDDAAGWNFTLEGATYVG